MGKLLIRLGNTGLSDEQVAQITAALPTGMTVLQATSRAEIGRHIDDIEIVAGYLPLPLLPQATALRWWQSWSAGNDWLLDHPAAQQMSFALTSAKGVHPIPISEHVFAMLLTFARQLHRSIEAQQRRTWLKVSFEAAASADTVLAGRDLFELAGKTMLIVGAGAIGARTAQLAKAFGMDVIGVRRNPANGVDGVDRMVSAADLLSVLPEADVVVSAVPLTAETRNQLDAEAFAAMKKGAILINIGRGGTVDEAALIAALESGHLGGAGLDVTAKEPLSADSPLWTMKNVLITAHYSGDTPHYDERVLAILLENLERYKRGEPLLNLVDKAAGY